PTNGLVRPSSVLFTREVTWSRHHALPILLRPLSTLPRQKGFRVKNCFAKIIYGLGSGKFNCANRSSLATKRGLVNGNPPGHVEKPYTRILRLKSSSI